MDKTQTRCFQSRAPAENARYKGKRISFEFAGWFTSCHTNHTLTCKQLAVLFDASAFRSHPMSEHRMPRECISRTLELAWLANTVVDLHLQ